MKKHTNIEFTKKEAQAIAEALDIASNISNIEEDETKAQSRLGFFMPAICATRPPHTQKVPRVPHGQGAMCHTPPSARLPF